jgi:hypothetical protein
MIMTRVATESDIEGILRLQAVNLYSNLSEQERSAGFVTTPFSVEQLQGVLAETGAFVAVKEDVVMGYALAASWDFFSQWPIFPYMVSRFPQIQFHGTQITARNTFQYGPVCIGRDLRGSGVFPELFGTMRSHMAQRFPIGVTFINQVNGRSFAAHAKLNLEVIDEFEFNGNSFYGLAFSTK